MESFTYIFLWITAAAMLIMTVILLSGRGSGLIAGYNTSSETEKAKYAEKKLNRVMGCGLLIIAIVLVFSLCFKFDFPYKFMEYIVIGIIVLTAALMLILGNTICHRK